MNYTKGGWRYDGKGLVHIEGDLGMGYTEVDRVIAAAMRPVWMGKETQDANAHLIAAAPEMYEALKLLLERFNGLEKEYAYPMALDLPRVWAEKALAKAEGRTK